MNLLYYMFPIWPFNTSHLLNASLKIYLKHSMYHTLLQHFKDGICCDKLTNYNRLFFSATINYAAHQL